MVNSGCKLPGGMTRSTTVIGVRRDGKSAIAADGQVTLGEASIIKHSARKVHRLGGGRVVCGFAGSVADAQALLDRFEAKLEAHNANLRRAAIEFAKEWRMDKVLRQLNAMVVAADDSGMLLIGGDGNVLEPDDGVIAIGSGGPYAMAAARALVQNTEMGAEEVARKALAIAAEICIYTNDVVHVEVV